MSTSPAGCREISTGNFQRPARRWVASNNRLTTQLFMLSVSDLSREFPCTEITIEQLFTFVAIATEFLVCSKFPRHGNNGKIPMKDTDIMSSRTCAPIYTRACVVLETPVCSNQRPKCELLWNSPCSNLGAGHCTDGKLFLFGDGWGHCKLTAGTAISREKFVFKKFSTVINIFTNWRHSTYIGLLEGSIAQFR